MARKLISEKDAMAEVIDKINEARESKRWMVLVYAVDESEDKKTAETKLVGRITWMFPTDSFGKAVTLLEESIKAEMGGDELSVPPPLKMADFGEFEQANTVDGTPDLDQLDHKTVEKEYPEFPSPMPMSIGEFMGAKSVEEKESQRIPDGKEKQ